MTVRVLGVEVVRSFAIDQLALGEAGLSTRSIVHWECHSPEHRALHSRHGNGGLTIHEGAWAYCDGAGANDAHHWSATGGMHGPDRSQRILESRAGSRCRIVRELGHDQLHGAPRAIHGGS